MLFDQPLCRVLSLAVWLAATVTTSAAEWGQLSGRLTFNGKLPERPLLELSQDAAYCMKSMPRDESLLVEPQSKGLANVVIWLEPASGTPLPIHPDYMRRANQPVELSNLGCHFKPRVAVLWTQQPFVMKNDDDIIHNMFGGPQFNDPFNALLAAKSKQEVRFTRAEKKPFMVKCSIHAWMTGFVMVKDHPYAVATDAAGKFELRDLPTGSWNFVFWHERFGSLSTLRLKDAARTNEKGRHTFEIKPGANPLGEISVETALLEAR